jgi:Ca2+-binding EF-hand superfamily protein
VAKYSFGFQEKLIRQAWDMFDVNHDGRIAPDELDAVLHQLSGGNEFQPKQVKDLMNAMDLDQDGTSTLFLSH